MFKSKGYFFKFLVLLKQLRREMRFLERKVHCWLLTVLVVEWEPQANRAVDRDDQQVESEEQLAQFWGQRDWKKKHNIIHLGLGKS